MFSSYTHLVATLADGWKIEPPVFVRARRRSANGKENVYHFILWNGTQANLISVIDCPELQHFLDDRKLALDHL